MEVVRQDVASNEAGPWTDCLVQTCRRHPELAAVFESPSGEVALLLHDTLVPLREESVAWLSQTRASVRPIMADLRGAGLRGAVTVVQWRPLREAEEILTRWTCRYDGDATRRTQLADVARRYVQDEAYLTKCTTRARARSTPRAERVTEILLGPAALPLDGPSRAGEDWRHALARWYRSMAPCWRSVSPWVRRELMLTAHIWLATRVIRAAVSPVAWADLTENGELGLTMGLCIPAPEREDWEPWLRLVLGDLRQALRRPLVARDEGWGRWLFLIPYSVPTPKPRRPPEKGALALGAVPGGTVAARTLRRGAPVRGAAGAEGHGLVG